MKHNLLAPTQKRRGRVALTLVASLVFHGSLVGVAALWPYHPHKEPAPLPPITGVADDPFTNIEQTPDPSTPEPVKYELPPPMEPTPQIPDNDTPPPMLDEEMHDPLAAPPLHSVAILPTHPKRISDYDGTRGPTVSVAHAGTPNIVPGPVHPGTTTRWNVSAKPPYPMSLRAAHIQGTGAVHVTTDRLGRVVQAAMSQSTGNTVLDLNTCRYARTFWTGPANSSIDVPITYQLD